MQRLQQLLAFWTVSTGIDPRSAANMFHRAQDTTIHNGDFKVAGRDINVQQNTEARDRPLAKLMDVSAPGALYDSSERSFASRCLEGTRQSQLTDIMTWVLDGSSDARPIMWLSGGAGAGKSSIAQTVAESTAKHGRLAGSFFFRQGDPIRSSATRVFPTIALQLAVSNKELESLIEASIMNHPLVLTDKTMGVQFSDLILQPLDEAGATYSGGTSVVVLDGLDECDDPIALQQLLSVISDNLGTDRPPLRFFITSRPKFPIEAFFRTIPQLHEHIHLGRSYEADQDIHKYLLHGFSEIRTRHSDILPPAVSWPSDDDINHLVENSSGQFIYASTVLKFVDYHGDHPNNSLRFILSQKPLRSGRQSVYADLDALYLAILHRAVVYEHEDLLRLLSAISSRKLDICGTAKVLDIALEEVQVMLRCLRSMVDASDSWSSKLTFLHASFRDFLMDSSRSREFHIGGNNHSIHYRISSEKIYSYERYDGALANDKINLQCMRIGVHGKWALYRVLHSVLYSDPQSRPPTSEAITRNVMTCEMLGRLEELAWLLGPYWSPSECLPENQENDEGPQVQSRT